MKFFYLMIIAIFFCSLVSSQTYDKIHQDVLSSLKENKNVRVIVNMKEPLHESRFLRTQKSSLDIKSEKEKNKEEVISKIPEEKVKRIFEKSIALEISEKELNDLEKNQNIESIIIDNPVKAFLQDSIPLINATKVWPIQISGVNITGTGESVCVIDTGINASHPDFQGRVIAQYCYCSVGEGVNPNCCPSGVSEESNASDNNGHGTHVSGIIGASSGINGVALNVNLVSIKALNSSGSGVTSDIKKAIDWCVSNFSIYNISVISMSLGGGLYTSYCNSDPLADSINSAVAKNISVIVASGNDGSSASISSPACVQNATSVGSTSKTDLISSFSNRNNLTKLVAPGENINSTYNNGKYSSASGTSMSTPHVAGAFALVRQFFRLQNGRTPTPSEIESVLNNTGKRISDSANGLNFSRINIYQAIISLDNVSPNVTLISPPNSSLSSNTTQTFSCNATDNIGLTNITFFVWNSSKNNINQTTFFVSGFSNQSSLHTANLEFGNYEWNCLASDLNGNLRYAESNFSLTLSNLSVSLLSPSNNLFTNQNYTNFNCSSNSNSELKNITLLIWNSSSYLIYNLTQNISGNSNTTNFQYNLTTESNYIWNCEVYANNSQSIIATSNYTFTFDISPPTINLISPNNSSSYSSNSQQIDFNYNLTENFNISNCNLVINGLINLTNSSINNLSATQKFTQSFAPGEYNWEINCTDYALNSANSSQRIFSISSVQAQTTSSSSSGGGGGGAIAQVNTYTITSNQFSSGYTQEMNKGDKIKFTFFDEKTIQHTLTLDYISDISVNMTIQSQPIKLTLGIGQSIKLNLTSPNYYDLYIKLDEIVNKKAKVTIQTINEPIYVPVKTIQQNVTETNETASSPKDERKKESEEIAKLTNMINKLKFYIIILFIIILVLIVLKKKRSKKHYFIVHMK